MDPTIATGEHRQVHTVGGDTEADALIGVSRPVPPNIVKFGEAPEAAITCLV
jgi:hypothetical protein